MNIPLPGIDFCAIMDPANSIYPVPATQGLPYLVATSGSGRYYYTTPCMAFVVDVKMATYSNTDPIQGTPTQPGDLIIRAKPYDLPSSLSFGGDTPIVKEDCGRLKLWCRYYRKLHNEDHFTVISTYSMPTPSWQSGSCQVLFATGHAKPSAEGWDTYRVAVRAILRSSAQEVGVWLDQVPPV